MFDELCAGLAIHPLTQQLVTHLFLDLPLTPAMCVDFGMDSAHHYRALKEVFYIEAEEIEDEALAAAQVRQTLRQRILELDAAIGNGPMLNAFVQKYAPAYAAQVKFSTSRDVSAGRAEPAED